MKEKITIVSTPHERPKSQTIKSVPQTEQEFHEIVSNSSWAELKEYGFRKWDTMNSIIKENITHKDDSKVFSIPTYNLDEASDAIIGAIEGNLTAPSGSMLIDLSSKDPLPMELLEEDEDLILFPGEWYNIIPDGFKCTSLNGELSIFQKGKSDDDIRFGCIAYGIRMKAQHG